MTSPVSMPAGHAILATDLDAYENATAAWVTWSPTLTNLTLGDGSVVAKYRQVGKTVDWRFRFVNGSSSAVGTDPRFTLPPATPNADYATGAEFLFPGRAWLLDTGTRFSQADLVHAVSGTLQIVYWSAINSTASITATLPWTWATGDTLNAYGRYEAA